MRLPLLCALNFAVLAGGMTTTASDLSRPLGDPQLERPTLARWASTGSSRATTTRTPSSLEYRKAGSSPWRTAARPHHRARPPRRARLGRRHGNRSRFLPGPGSRPEGRGSRRPVPGGSRRLRGTWTVNRSGTPGQLVARLRLTIGMLRATMPISSPFPGGCEPGASISISNGPGFAAKTIVSGTNITYCRIVQTKELKR